MNFQVNLILDSEKRSGSTVSLKFVVRVLAVGIPVIMGIIIAGLVLASRSARQNLRFVAQEQNELEPVYKKAVGLKQELNECRRLAEVLNGWTQSRTDWFILLSHLQRAVPPSIQFLRLTVNDSIAQVDNAPVRKSGMYIKGKVVGDHGEEEVQLLDRILKEETPFKDLFSRVEVKRFAADENMTNKNIRVFEIECILKPKKIYKP